MNKNHAIKLALVLLFGSVFGMAVSASDVLPTWFFSRTMSDWLFVPGMVLNSALLWCLLPFVFGSYARSLRGAVLIGFTLLIAMLFGYYLFGSVWGDRQALVGSTALSKVILFWLTAACVVGPASAILGYLAVRKIRLLSFLPVAGWIGFAVFAMTIGNGGYALNLTAWVALHILAVLCCFVSFLCWRRSGAILKKSSIKAVNI